MKEGGKQGRNREAGDSKSEWRIKKKRKEKEVGENPKRRGKKMQGTDRKERKKPGKGEEVESKKEGEKK